MADVRAPYPVTPDGRYFVVRGRLWRCSNPTLDASTREDLVKTLMQARQEIGAARRTGDGEAEADGRARVDAAKIALGERGPVWWRDRAPDLNRRLVRNTPYRDWFAALGGAANSPSQDHQ